MRDRLPCLRIAVFQSVKRRFTSKTGYRFLSTHFLMKKSYYLKWIVAIRRDIDKHFQVTKHTRVCSRHFKPSHYLPSLVGRKRTLKPTAVPSVFHWKKRSPVKRKAPTRRRPIKRKTEGHRKGNYES